MLNIVKGQILYVLLPDNITIKPTKVIDVVQIYTETEEPCRYMDIYTRYLDVQTDGTVTFRPCDFGKIIFENEIKAKINLCLNNLDDIAVDFYKNGCPKEDFQIYRIKSFIQGLRENIGELKN